VGRAEVGMIVIKEKSRLAKKSKVLANDMNITHQAYRMDSRKTEKKLAPSTLEQLAREILLKTGERTRELR